MTRAATANVPAALTPRAEWLDRLDPAVAAVLDEPAGTDPERLTRRLALGHYENFSVISLALPRRLRQDFCNVYAFCRAADDLGDELSDPLLSLRMLARLRRQTEACFDGETGVPLFAALRRSIDRHDLPMEPFLDLIDAFEQDQRVARYETVADLLDYCRRSANPVGRLVLAMSGHHDTERRRLSDLICTGLQLANFWQDVRRDWLERGRLYLPAESMARVGLSESDVIRMAAEGRADGAFREVIRAEVDRAAAMFDEGAALLPLLDRSVRRQVGLFAAGGRATLAAIRAADYDTLARRPALSRWAKARLVIGALLPRHLSARARHGISTNGGGAAILSPRGPRRAAPASPTPRAAIGQERA